MTITYTATASNGSTFVRKSAKPFAYCVAYVGNHYEAPAWAGSRALAEKVADVKRGRTTKKGTVVFGMVVEIIPAVAQ